MSQVTFGVRAVLNQPSVYDFFQDIMGARRSRKLFVREFVQPFAGCAILDLGCGTARILDYLPSDIRYHGFDLSELYIEQARNRYAMRGKFECSSVDDVVLKQLPKFDRVIAIGLLHHIDDDRAYGLFKLAHAALKSGGQLVTIDPCFSDDQNFLSHYLVSRDRGLNVRSGNAYYDLANTVFSKVTGKVRHQFWIPYTRWFMNCVK